MTALGSLEVLPNDAALDEVRVELYDVERFKLGGGNVFEPEAGIACLLRCAIDGDWWANRERSARESNGRLIVRGPESVHQRVAQYLASIESLEHRVVRADALYRHAVEHCNAGDFPEARDLVQEAAWTDARHEAARTFLARMSVFLSRLAGRLYWEAVDCEATGDVARARDRAWEAVRADANHIDAYRLYLAMRDRLTSE